MAIQKKEIRRKTKRSLNKKAVQPQLSLGAEEVQAKELDAETQDSQDQPRRLKPIVLIAGIVLAVVILFFAMRFLYSADSSLHTQGARINLTPTIVAEEQELPSKEPLKPLNHTFMFDEVFNRLRDIDKAYNTDFRKESLSKSVLSIKSIDPALGDVRILRDDINRSAIGNETVFWIHLVEGRILQLESEKYFQLALQYGKDGLFKSRDVEGSCARQQKILDASLLYNRTSMKGGNAMYHFDMALTQEKTWPLLGINDKRMAFFGGDTRDIGALAYNNVELVRVKCLGLPREETVSVEETLDYKRMENLSRKY